MCTYTEWTSPTGEAVFDGCACLRGMRLDPLSPSKASAAGCRPIRKMHRTLLQHPVLGQCMEFVALRPSQKSPSVLVPVKTYPEI
jgi:hypothetical protein